MDATTLIYGAGFVTFTTFSSLSVYFIARKLTHSHQSDETNDLSGSVMLRVAGLHSLILALVFAQENQDYSRIRQNIVDEATAIADIYNDIRRYETPEMAGVQKALRDYTSLVVEREWPNLALHDRLLAEGWRIREDIYLSVLDLDPATPRQASLRDHMVRRAQDIAVFRQDRENAALEEINGLFWFAAFSGLFLVTVPYFVFPPTRLHLALLAIYGAYSGIIFYTIYAFSDPFSLPGRLEPTAFHTLLKTEIGGG